MFGKIKKNKRVKKSALPCRKNRNGISVFDRAVDFFSLYTCDLQVKSDLKAVCDSDFKAACDSDACDLKVKKRDDFSEKSELKPDSKLKRADPELKKSDAGCKLEDSYLKADLVKTDDKAESIQVYSEDFFSAQDKKVKKNRHGLPVLDGLGSLSKMFQRKIKDQAQDEDKDKDQDQDEDNFSAMLFSSLNGKGFNSLMRAKKDKVLPEPVPLKKRLKRYPPPEKHLDLHGFNAAGAEERAESFLRTALRNGNFTLRIVVGRGLHSRHGAVLPDVVEDLLRRLKKEGVVLWFEWDRKKKSRSGAVIVYLKQFND